MFTRLSSIFCFVVVLVFSVQENVNVKIWNGVDDFPELDLENIQKKQDVGLAFSGGGARALVAGSGYLSGLRDNEVLYKARFMSGVSGGCWMASIFSFQQLYSDTELLGELLHPSEITIPYLYTLNTSRLHAAVAGDANADILAESFKWIHTDNNYQDLVVGLINRMYLKKFGITMNDLVSYNEETRDEILYHNPDLQKYKWALQREEHPYWFCGISIFGLYNTWPRITTPLNIGYLHASALTMGQKQHRTVFSSTPDDLVCKTEYSWEEKLADLTSRKERVLMPIPLVPGDVIRFLVTRGRVLADTEYEVLPHPVKDGYLLKAFHCYTTTLPLLTLYKGQATAEFIEIADDVNPADACRSSVGGADSNDPHADVFSGMTMSMKKAMDFSFTVGGKVETYGFGSMSPKNAGTSGSRVQTTTDTLTTLALINTASSAALETLLRLHDSMGTNPFKLKANYWSPVDETPANVCVELGDGGNLENQAIMPLLERNVSRIIMFTNTPTVLQGPATFDPVVDSPVGKIDSTFASLFGYHDASNFPGSFYGMNHVFEQDQFGPFVAAAQQNMMDGKGAVATAVLTTVQNDFFGVAAGVEIKLTMAHLSRVFDFESALPEELQQLVIPETNATDPTSLRQTGPFAQFPHYPTGYNLPPEQANLLHHLTEFIVRINPEHFETEGTIPSNKNIQREPTEEASEWLSLQSLLIVALVGSATMLGNGTHKLESDKKARRLRNQNKKKQAAAVTEESTTE